MCVCVCVCLSALFKLKKYINVDCACDWQISSSSTAIAHCKNQFLHTHTHTRTARNCERETGAYYDIFFVVLCFLHTHTHIHIHTHAHARADKAMLTGRGVAVVNKRARCPLSLTERCGEGAGEWGVGGGSRRCGCTAVLAQAT